MEPTQRAFEGMPSTPGYRPGQLNRLTDWAVRDSSNRPVICEFRPDGLWLWTKWRGTVLSFTVVPVLFMILLAFFTDAPRITYPPPPGVPAMPRLTIRSFDSPKR